MSSNKKAKRNRAEKAYTTHHWGYPSTHEKSVDMPGLDPDHPLTEMGILTHMHLGPVDDVDLPVVKTTSLDRAAARTGDEPKSLSVIEVDTEAPDAADNHLSWDPNHPRQRLYLHLSPQSRRDAAALFDPALKTYTLAQLASMAGGHQTKGYPSNVRAQPLGILYYVSYYTLKEDDAGEPSPSIYIHRMGEEGGLEPILAVSSDGNLWICGGSYTVPVNGITR